MPSHPPKTIRSSVGLKLLERTRKICGLLPDVSEVIDGFGHVVFKAGKKTFIMMGEGEKGTSISIKATPAMQQVLVREAMFFETPYIGRHGWFSFKAGAKVSIARLRELITNAYRLAATKKMLKQLDEGTPGQ